ncbi:MAG TPA: hypothetical protein VK590_09725 [Saprospiraceae bacterium]|nr:hypothetical protein [Saprospiraceae bacterium]
MSNSRLDSLLAMLIESPNDSFIIYAIAKEYESQEIFDKALEYYEILDNNDPDYVGRYYHHGKLLWKLGKDEESLQVLDKGIETAKRVGDQHALGEMKQLRWEISDEDM